MHWGVEDHAATSGGLGGAGRRRLRCASLLTAAKPPLASVTGQRTSCCSSLTSASFQALVQCRGQGGGDREHGDAGALVRLATETEETTVVQTL